MEKIEAWETEDTAIFKSKQEAAKHEVESFLWRIITEEAIPGVKCVDISNFIFNRKEDVKTAIKQYEDLMAQEK